jgi:hypothetical protein
MDQVKFRGYAQQQGFQPIQAPYGTLDRMREQANRTLRGMEANAEALTARRNEYEQQLRSKLAKEQQNRSDVYEFERQARRSYQEGDLRNLKLQAETVEQPNIENLKSLTELSTTIGKLVSDYGEKKKQDDLLYGQNLVFQYGLTPKKLEEYEAQKGQLTAAATAANGVANQMEFRGVPISVYEEYRKLSGWKLYGATRAYAQNGAQDYVLFRSTAADTQIPFGDSTITLSTARSTEEWEYANSFIRNEFLKSYNGINPALLNEHLYPKMKDAESRERISYQEARNKVLAENRKEEEGQNLLGFLKSGDPGAGMIEWINQTSGGDPAMRGAKKREAFTEHINKWAAAGIISRDTLDQIAAGSYLRADGQVRNIGEDFKLQLADAYDAAYQREKRTLDEREFQQAEQENEFKKQVYDNIERGVPLNQDAVDSLIKQYEANFDREAPSWLKDLKTRTTEHIEGLALDAYLQDLDNRNLLTTRELNRYLSSNPDLVAKYKSKASENDNLASLPKERVESAKREINARIKEILTQTGSDKVDSSAFIAASDQADRLFNEKVRYEMSVGNLNPQAAVDSAKQYIKNLIEDGKQGKGGPFLMKGKVINNKFYPNLNQAAPFVFQGKIPDTIAAKQRARDVRAGINNRTLNIESDVFLKPDELKNLERIAKGQGGSFAPILASVAAGRLDQNGNPRTVKDIANAQLRASGSTLQIGLSGADQIYKGLDPRWQIRLSSYPSTANTYQAFSAAANYKPLLDLIASRESMGYGQYDAMNRGGAAGGTVAIGSANSVDVFGRGLSSMTVSEVMDLQRSNKVHAAGRYQIIASTLRGLMNGSYGSTGVNPDDRFDAATQDKLAIALLKGRAGRFLNGSGSISGAVTGMGQEWIGLQNEKARQLLTTRLQQLKTTLQAQSAMRQPDSMRTNVVYRVGNIGPTSTGAHLHVGAKDGGFFHRSFLDKYIRVGKKKDPLSKGVTVAGGVFGAGRDYGSHKAWDFAFDDGTPVYLSNGAQVVGNRKTQHGDELVIQLPNGRQFYFLHGNAS